MDVSRYRHCGRRLRCAYGDGCRQEVLSVGAEGNTFPSLTQTEEELLRALIREEVANGIRTSMCVNGCVRMKLVMWGLGAMYASLIGITLGSVFGG